MHSLGQNLMGTNCIEESKLKSLLFQLIFKTTTPKQLTVLLHNTGTQVWEGFQLTAHTAPLATWCSAPSAYQGIGNAHINQSRNI